MNSYILLTLFVLCASRTYRARVLTRPKIMWISTSSSTPETLPHKNPITEFIATEEIIATTTELTPESDRNLTEALTRNETVNEKKGCNSTGTERPVEILDTGKDSSNVVIIENAQNSPPKTPKKCCKHRHCKDNTCSFTVDGTEFSFKNSLGAYMKIDFVELFHKCFSFRTLLPIFRSRSGKVSASISGQTDIAPDSKPQQKFTLQINLND